MTGERYAEPDWDAIEAAGWSDDAEMRCSHCGDPVIKNYDGRGTGWSHIWPPEHPLWRRSGTKQCRDTNA